jgi:AGZA family xanthine/uracil permease-like MFS transporter
VCAVFFGNFGTAIAVGIAGYVLIRALLGRFREIPVGLWIVMVPLAYFFYTLAT